MLAPFTLIMTQNLLSHCTLQQRIGTFDAQNMCSYWKRQETEVDRNKCLWCGQSLDVRVVASEYGSQMVIVCNVESTGLSLVWDSYCVGTLSKFFALNCSAISLFICTACKCTSQHTVKWVNINKDRLYCIVLSQLVSNKQILIDLLKTHHETMV